MRLRYLLTGCMLLALLVLGVRIVQIERATRESEALELEQAEVQLIARDAARLLELGQQYLLRPTPDGARRWYAVHAELARAIRRDAANSRRRIAGDSTMQSLAEQLPGLFDSLSSPGAPDRRELLGDQLLDATRRISDASFSRVDLLSELRRGQDLRQRREMFAAHVALLALMAVLGYLIFYRVLGPIARLRAAAQAVERGEPGARSALRGSDEFAQLSRAFDLMIESLHQRNASLLEGHRRLERSEAFHARAARIAGLGSWEYDLGTQEMRWSEQTRRIHEVDDDFQPDLESALDFYPLAARQELRTRMDAAFERRQGWDLELPFVTARGRHRWVRASGTAEYEDDQPVRLAGAFQDVTERREIEQELRLATREAKAANAAKSTLLANMSHAVRTPMNATMGVTYLLRRTPLDDEQRQLVDKLEQSNDSLLGVIEDVLDLSKMESGELVLAVRPFDLPRLIAEVAERVRTQAERVQLAFEVEVAPALPVLVDGDRSRIRQILINLLDNAIRHTESGSVRLRVSHAPREDDGATVEFNVEDSGVGIAPAVLERLFMLPAAQDARAISHPVGTGLGLSMVKTLTELMAGEVSASSTPGVGTCVKVALPLRLAGDRPPVPAPPPVAIALVQAGPATRAQIEQAAADLGWEIEAADRADELGQPLTARLSEGRPVVAVLTDAPEQNEQVQSLAESLRRDGAAGGLPIVRLIESGDAADPRGIELRGRSDSILAKPVDAAGLFNAIYAALARQRADTGHLLRGSRLDRAGLVRLAGVHVLVVDDSAINREVIQRILTSEGAQVTLAPDGEQAIAVLRDAPQRFDVVLMDVQMPLLDGNMATRRIRGELGLGRLPVIALTAGARAAERKRSLEAGMDDVLTKPIDAPQMIDLLHHHVAQARGAVLPVASLTRAPARVALVEWPELNGIESDLAWERFGGDIDAFASALGELLHEFDPVAMARRLSPPGADRQRLAERMHRLAGAAAGVGATAVSARASAAESGLRHARQEAECTLLLDVLAASWERLRMVCSAWLQQRSALPAAPVPGASGGRAASGG